MSEREDMERRLYEACLSGSVAELDALIEKDQLILDRANLFTCFFNDTPLHVAALRGHLDLTKALLTRNPKLAFELDSLRCSPLHLASTKGHVEIERELLRMNTSVCLARDQDGRIPLHLAAIKGRVEVVRELLRAKPESIREKLDRGETVLHLCVKYNRLEALKTLVGDLRGSEFLLSSKDNDGNTILHIAAALKQIDTIKYLLGLKSVKEHCAKVKNNNGSTALDVVEYCPNKDLKIIEIREFLLQAGVRRSVCSGSNLNPESPPDDYNPPPPPRYCGCIIGFWTKYIAVDPLWLKEVRGHLITAATLTATMAYQAILSPPGGFWQETKDNHTVGTAVLDNTKDMHYFLDSIKLMQLPFNGRSYNVSTAFLGVNSVVLFASLCTIMLALSGIPHHNKLLLWLLIFAVYITLSCMAIAYQLAITLLFPSQMENHIFSTALSLHLVAWFGVVAFVLVLHTCHFLVWLGKNFVNLIKMCFCPRRRRRRRRPGRT